MMATFRGIPFLGLAATCAFLGCNPPNAAPVGSSSTAEDATSAEATARVEIETPAEEAASTASAAPVEVAATPADAAPSEKPAATGKAKAKASKVEAAPSAESDAKAAPEDPGKAKVAKIVFVGKEFACECTRKSIDAGWAALQKALGKASKLPVEKLEYDTEGSKVAKYKEQEAMVAVPAIYFVDAEGKVLELIQGEITAAQVTAALKKP